MKVSDNKANTDLHATAIAALAAVAHMVIASNDAARWGDSCQKIVAQARRGLVALEKYEESIAEIPA